MNKALAKRNLEFNHSLKGLKNKIKLINIWAGKKKTISKWHFDAYNNFNYILKVRIILK
jgi:hypothetical protein